jgi:hypothetical protein
LPNDSVEGERLIPGAVPVPLTAILLGLPAPLCEIETAALLLPVDPGVNVTLIVQVALGARAALQVLLCANCALSVPVTDTPLTVRFAVPVFVIVTVCALLVVLIS